MALTANPFILKNVSLTLEKTSALTVGGIEQEYRCTLNQAQLTPSTGGAGGGATYETFCQPYDAGTAASGSTWTLDLNGWQQYQDALDLSLLLFENEGTKYTYVLIPENPLVDGVPTTTHPGFTGEVTATPTQIGGTAAQYATFTVSLPCVSKPVKITAPTP